MNNIITTVSNEVSTISSIEIVRIINKERGHMKAILRHDHFMVKVEKHPGFHSPEFLGQYKDTTGRSLKCYNLPKREAQLMVMTESLEVQTRVYDRMVELEAVVASTAPVLPVTKLEWMRLAIETEENLQASNAKLAVSETKLAIADKTIAIAAPVVAAWNTVVADKRITVTNFVRMLPGVNTMMALRDLQAAGHIYNTVH